MRQLKIEGMSCSHCRQAVMTALERVPGTQRVEVDLATGTAQVEGNADLDALVAAVAAEGYRASPAGQA